MRSAMLARVNAPRLVALVVVVLVVAGCASIRRPVEERTTQGPTAEEFWIAAIATQNRREPTFEERRHWEDDLDARIDAYLHQHPEAANSLNVSGFRFLKQVSVGMDQEQVSILLGPPTQTLRQPQEMELAAHRFWPLIQPVATEAWVYPYGWTLFFAGQRLADIVRYPAPS